MRKQTKTTGRVLEEAEQVSLFAWADMMSSQKPALGMLVHVPNEGKRTAAAGGRLKAAGLRRGFPDLVLPMAADVEYGGTDWHANGLYIELKRPGGTVSHAQKWWLHNLNEQGNLALVCYGFEEAVEVLCRYLQMEKPVMGKGDYRRFEKILADTGEMLQEWADKNGVMTGQLAPVRILS